jgi:hypothetical protein
VAYRSAQQQTYVQHNDTLKSSSGTLEFGEVPPQALWSALSITKAGIVLKPFPTASGHLHTTVWDAAADKSQAAWARLPAAA